MEDNQFPYMILIIIGAIVLAAIIVMVIVYLLKKRKKMVEIKPDQIDNDMWVNALGGKDNILSLEAKGSRLIVNVKDNALVNKDSLHDLGVTSLIASQNKVTLVLKEKAENVRKLLQ